MGPGQGAPARRPASRRAAGDSKALDARAAARRLRRRRGPLHRGSGPAAALRGPRRPGRGLALALGPAARSGGTGQGEEGALPLHQVFFCAGTRPAGIGARVAWLRDPPGPERPGRPLASPLGPRGPDCGSGAPLPARLRMASLPGRQDLSIWQGI